MNELPNFLCVGAQKAGTTSLHDILTQHPDVYLPKIKETKFFAENEKYEKGLSFYMNEYFSSYKDQKIIGEIDPEYMYYDFVPERIYKTLGKDVKLIFMLRNPVSRAYSHYQMSLRRGYETLSFDEAISLESERIQNDDTDKKWLSNKNNFSYIDRGYYSQQIKRYLEFFPKENMHFILFEDEFLKDKETSMLNIYRFLNISNENTINLDLKSNPASEPKYVWIRDIFNNDGMLKNFAKLFLPTNLRKELRQKILNMNLKKITIKLDTTYKKEILEKYYLSEIKELEIIIEKDLSSWLK